jgi:hypothetical protein
MLKKSLIFGSVALFLAALITLTGCPTSVDDDGSSGTKYAHRIYGTAVTPYQAQEAIDRAVAAGEPVVLEDGLSLAVGHLNFKTAQVRIDGSVTVATNTVISMADASVTWADNAFLTFTGGTGAYIYRKGQDTAKVTRAVLVEFAESLDTIMATATAAGVRRFKLGPKEDHDYSTDPNGINARIRANLLANLYVLDELVIDSGANNPNDVEITAMGTVDVTGTPPAGVIVGVAGTLDLGTCSILTTSRGGVVVSVPGGAATTIPNIKVDEGKNFVITQDTAANDLTIAGKLTGKGTLEVLGAVTDLTIAGGDGSIRFSGAADPAVITSRTTGTITFDQDLANLTGAASVIAGDAVFNGDLTTDDDLSLLGNVTLANDAVVTLDTGKTLTLGANKTVSVRFTPRNVDTVIAPVLIAGPGNVVLTAGGASTLTVPGNPSQITDAAIAAAKRLTLAGADLEITDGVLRVAPDAALAVDTQALTTGITATEIGYLALEDGASLVLVGTGSMGIGDTTINAASTLKASGGTITLGNNKIAGSALGAVLAPAAGSPVFTLDSAAGGKLLTLEQTNLNLAANGSVVIEDDARMILAKQAKITLNNGEGGVPTTRSKIGANGFLSGGFVGLTSPSATTTQAVWSVAHKDAEAADVSITATGADVTLAKSGTTFTN